MEKAVQRLKALGEPTRLRMLALLRHGERCVCDLMAVLDMPQSSVSRHLSVLRSAGWVAARKGGTWTYYSLHPEGEGAWGPFLDSLLDCLASEAQATEDQRVLAEFLKTKDPNACA
ncbi:helix-turn-helix transcriptional regulator [Desulfovibrio sp. X2]|uniref:ArsR/SmtB family transcription factor n=1 Tax=Desulfovibrio sp. X2 TaxID=941449 RepID=UPI0004110855|nr:metalloregulator ArsR/SmtB family transcription factor [Desulfovibrio sp. X2]